jgi:ATP synthase protein I
MAEQPPEDQDTGWGKYLGIGLEMAVGVGLGYLVGAWLDRRQGWSPWGVVIGTLVGMAAGMYLLIKEAMRINRN